MKEKNKPVPGSTHPETRGAGLPVSWSDRAKKNCGAKNQKERSLQKVHKTGSQWGRGEHVAGHPVGQYEKNLLDPVGNALLSDFNRGAPHRQPSMRSGAEQITTPGYGDDQEGKGDYGIKKVTDSPRTEGA